MAITIKHRFTSPKGDGTDATLIRPSNWNDTHDIDMAANRLLGRLTAGPGDAEEIPLSTYFATLLNAADYNSLALLLGLPTTGDARLTYKGVAPAGWVLANDGSIGNTLSGATTRANPDTMNLFTFFYDFFSDTWVPIQTKTGVLTNRATQGTSAVAWAADCRLVLPRQLGRALIIGGTGSGLTNRVVSSFGGEEGHVMTVAEMPSHGHTYNAGSLSSTSISGTATGSCSTTLSNIKTGFQDANHAHTTDPGNTASWGNVDTGYDLAHSHTYTACANVSSTGGGGFATGYASPGAATANSGSLNHAHYVDIGGTGSGIEQGGVYGGGLHKHSMDGTYGGSSSINSWIGVTVSGTCNGSISNNGSGNTFNIMQPWTAWNVMIRL